MTSHFLLAIFDQVTSKPIVPKTAAWRAAALATWLGITMLAYPAHAALASGGDGNGPDGRGCRKRTISRSFAKQAPTRRLAGRDCPGPPHSPCGM